MSSKLSLDGMADLISALTKIPEQAKEQSTVIVLRYANTEKNETINGYPRVSGNLRDHVTVSSSVSAGVSVTAKVKSTAHHAWLFEHGTEGKIRYYKGASRGAMPAAQPSQQMIPKAIRLRARMVNELVDLVKTLGFEVTQS